MPESPKPKKSLLYFGNIEDMAQSGEYVTPEMLQQSAKKRNDWNEFVSFLTEKGVVGSPNLDKKGAGTAYLNMWNKLNPEKSLSNEDVRAVQEFARKKEGATGIRVADGILGQVTSTFKFPTSATTTHSINPNTGEKTLIKTEDTSIGNFAARADQLNFFIAAKRGDDFNKLPIYNPNSTKLGVNLGKGYEDLSQKATAALREQAENRLKSGRSLEKPEEFVKPIVATQQHPATQTQRVGNPFDKNRRLLAQEDISKGITEGKQAKQERIDYISEVQRKFKDSNQKLSPDEAIMYFQETGKLAPQNRVAGKYKKDEKGNILDSSGKTFMRPVDKKALRENQRGGLNVGGKFKDLGSNIKRGAIENRADKKNKLTDVLSTAGAALFTAAAIPNPALWTLAGPALASSPAGDYVVGGIRGALNTFDVSLGKKKKRPMRAKNKEFLAPTFE
jgi:hypothetical protein